MLRRRRQRVAEVVFVTRAGCSMCAEALPLVERLTREAGVPLTVADVDADASLAGWSDHVPVVLLDGVEHSRWWVDETALRKAL
jgi:glutaredoxin